ncbi:MAG: hypothetical protein HRF51_06660 [bacterium]
MRRSAKNFGPNLLAQPAQVTSAVSLIVISSLLFFIDVAKIRKTEKNVKRVGSLSARLKGNQPPPKAGDDYVEIIKASTYRWGLLVTVHCAFRNPS